jgi:hypothetical protein
MAVKSRAREPLAWHAKAAIICGTGMTRKTIATTAVRWLFFLGAAALLVLGPFERTFRDGERYGYLPDIMPSDWIATNIWLDSSQCALDRGVWLALCEREGLVPISERAIADDPGHALVLELWSLAVGRRASLVDVARLNTLVDTIGLLALAGLVFALRAYVTSLLLLWLGPILYLGWMGTSPHWSYIGLVSLCALLPLALAAKSAGLLGRGAAWAWMGGGILALALASLMRESIGLMGLLVTLGTIVPLAIRRGRMLPLAITALLAVLAVSAPKWVVTARDAAYPDLQPAARVATHGLSHTLYLGLGVVENRWGIRYDDDYGAAVAAAVDPSIVFCSPEYFRLMGRLYLARWLEDPIEVVRIYLAKAWLLLSSYTMTGPPFGVWLALGAFHLLLATRTRAWQRIGFPQGLPIEGVAVSFLLLFLAQAMLALPSQTYAMPANAFIVLLLGVIVEFFLRLLLRVRPAW